jgi:hypothetical protein
MENFWKCSRNYYKLEKEVPTTLFFLFKTQYARNAIFSFNFRKWKTVPSVLENDPEEGGKNLLKQSFDRSIETVGIRS